MDSSSEDEDQETHQCGSGSSKDKIPLPEGVVESLMNGQLNLPFSKEFSLPSAVPCLGGCGEAYYCSLYMLGFLEIREVTQLMFTGTNRSKIFTMYIDYLFLGDCVDRGQHSLETITLLLALKIEYPENVHLICGNHEAADINALFGFRIEYIERMVWMDETWMQSIKVNPKELNPYLKDNGSGYPEESDRTKVGLDQLLSASLIGDGGASWRLKALKRAREAAREGRSFQEGFFTYFPDIVHLFHAIVIYKRNFSQELQKLEEYRMNQKSIDSMGDYIKEGQVIGYLDQFGTSLPVKVVELMAVMAKNPDLAYCKIVEVVTETTAPLTPTEELLAKISSQRPYISSPK
ncbi:hypothetical protein S83_055362, partial [Arachis hypogaea]